MRHERDHNAAVLFPWNPSMRTKYTWNAEFLACTPFMRRLANRTPAHGQWSIGNRLGVPAQAPAFLIRVGCKDRGVVLSGVTGDGRRRGLRSPYFTPVTWHTGIHWLTQPPMPLAKVFGAREAARIARATQNPGYSLTPEESSKLIRAWHDWLRHYMPGQATPTNARPSPIGGSTMNAVFFEGRATSQVVARYERDPRLKRALLALRPKHACDCCGLRPDRRYGPAFKGKLLQVHHLEQLASGPRTSKLEDVALLCPTCHQAVHATTPPMLPARLRALMAMKGAAKSIR